MIRVPNTNDPQVTGTFFQGYGIAAKFLVMLNSDHDCLRGIHTLK